LAMKSLISIIFLQTDDAVDVTSLSTLSRHITPSDVVLYRRRWFVSTSSTLRTHPCFSASTSWTSSWD